MGINESSNKSKQEDRQLKTLIISFATIFVLCVIGIILYPRLFQNSYPKAVSQAKAYYYEHKHLLNDLRYAYQTIATSFPQKQVSVSFYVNRNIVELRVDSVNEQGKQIHLGTYFDNWPISKPEGLKDNMNEANVGLIYNYGEVIYFKLDKFFLHNHDGYFIFSKDDSAGVKVDSNWFVVFKETKR